MENLVQRVNELRRKINYDTRDFETVSVSAFKIEYEKFFPLNNKVIQNIIACNQITINVFKTEQGYSACDEYSCKVIGTLKCLFEGHPLSFSNELKSLDQKSFNELPAWFRRHITDTDIRVRVYYEESDKDFVLDCLDISNKTEV